MCTLTIPLCLREVLENILPSKTAVIVVKILGVFVQNIDIREPGILCTLVLQDAKIEGGTIEIFATLRISNQCLLFWRRKFCLNDVPQLLMSVAAELSDTAGEK